MKCARKLFRIQFDRSQVKILSRHRQQPHSILHYRERDDALAIVFRNQGRVHSVSNTTPFVVTLETREYGGCRCPVCVCVCECLNAIKLLCALFCTVSQREYKSGEFLSLCTIRLYTKYRGRGYGCIFIKLCVDVWTWDMRATIVFVFTYYIFDE